MIVRPEAAPVGRVPTHHKHGHSREGGNLWIKARDRLQEIPAFAGMTSLKDAVWTLPRAKRTEGAARSPGRPTGTAIWPPPAHRPDVFRIWQP